MNLTIGGSVGYPQPALSAWITLTAHTDAADLAARTAVKPGESSPDLKISAELRMGEVTITDDVSAPLIPYHATAGKLEAALRLNQLRLALAGAWPSPVVTSSISYRYGS